MSEEPQESNRCPICGGTLRIDYTITFHQAHPHTMRVSDMSRMCFGHPEPERMHDGNIGDGCHVYYYDESWDAHGIRIEGGCCTGSEDSTFLLPHRALSLLAWLKQEEQHLTQMVAEEHEDHA